MQDVRSTLYGSGIPLNTGTLLKSNHPTKEHTLSIIALGLLGEEQHVNILKETVVATITRRLLNSISDTGTNQNKPHTHLIFDEAGYSFRRKHRPTSKVAECVSNITEISRKHRDKGVAVTIAAQRPKQIDTSVLSMMTGLKMIGKFDARVSEKKEIIDNVVGNSNFTPKDIRQMMDSLPCKSFMVMNSETTCNIPVIQVSPLKRLHESSALWASTNNIEKHPLKRFRVQAESV